MASNTEMKSSAMNFLSISQIDVTKGRDGKHKHIVMQLLSDLDKLKNGNALKIPLSTLPDTKENIRSALSRAANKKGLEFSTSSDGDFLYIWNDPQSKVTARATEWGEGRVAP